MKKLTTCLAALLLTAAPAAFAAAPPSGVSINRAPTSQVRSAPTARPIQRDARLSPVSDKDLDKRIDKLEKQVTKLEREQRKLLQARRRDAGKLRQVERELTMVKHDLADARDEQRARWAKRHRDDDRRGHRDHHR